MSARLNKDSIFFGKSVHDADKVAQFSDFGPGTRVRIKSGIYKGREGVIVHGAPFQMVRIKIKNAEICVVLTADLEPIERMEV